MGRICGRRTHTRTCNLLNTSFWARVRPRKPRPHAKPAVESNKHHADPQGFARVPQLPPPHHAGKVRDEPQHAVLVAAQQSQSAVRVDAPPMCRCAFLSLSVTDGHRGEHEGGEGRVLVDQEPEVCDQAWPVASRHVSLEDGWVNVALVVVGGALEDEPRDNIKVA